MSLAPRIVCLGSNIESSIALEALVNHGVNVVGVISADPANTAHISDYCDIAASASAFGIANIVTRSANDPAVIKFVNDTSADWIFVLGWSELLNAQLLAAPSQGVVGSHPSPIPHGKGRAPVAWTILRGDRRSAVTLFRMTEKVDEGQILDMVWFDIQDGGTARDLYLTIAGILGRAFCDLADQLADGNLPDLDASDLPASMYARRRPDDGWIDFSRQADFIDRLARAAGWPYPGAYAWLGDKKVIFDTARRAEGADLNYHGVEGQVLRKRKDWLLVQSGTDPVWLKVESVDGKAFERSMILLGDRFGFRVHDVVHDLRAKVRVLEQRIEQLEGIRDV